MSESIREQAKDLRKRHKLTQSELADIAGVSLPTLQRFEAGSETTQMDTVNKILAALGFELSMREINRGDSIHD